MHLECPGIFFPPRSSEGIDGSPDPDIHKAGFLEDPFPACARQAPCDSIRPEIDVADRLLRDRLAVCDIGELEPPAGAEGTPDL